MRIRTIWMVAAVTVLGGRQAPAEVVAAGDSGFQISVERKTDVDSSRVDEAIIQEVGDWWHPAHTFSGDAGNLSMDLQQRRFNEAMPGGGFITHMVITHYQPNELLRLVGGLGPLQEMGLQGALTMQRKAIEGKTAVTLTYNVSGYSPTGLKTLAPVVDEVLAQQMDRLISYVTATPQTP